jgi:hypothetical protein
MLASGCPRVFGAADVVVHPRHLPARLVTRPVAGFVESGSG